VTGTARAEHGRDPTGRFSDRVADYVRHRPGYPDAVYTLLREQAGLAPDAVIADIGAGTGISAALFLAHGHRVYAVEPNAAMRAAAVARLGDDPNFTAVDGSAEATTLPDASVDLVVAAQAFHWFRPAEAAREFCRVLRPDGGSGVALIWNTRRTDTPFLAGYEALLQEFGTDYAAIDHRHTGPRAIEAFFTGPVTIDTLPNEQRFDRDALRGRLLSSSYAPAPGHPRHAPMLAALDRLFDAHAEDGTVRFEYVTEIYRGSCQNRTWNMADQSLPVT
jgi:SAM-dependent methyltransferase